MSPPKIYTTYQPASLADGTRFEEYIRRYSVRAKIRNRGGKIQHRPLAIHLYGILKRTLKTFGIISGVAGLCCAAFGLIYGLVWLFHHAAWWVTGPVLVFLMSALIGTWVYFAVDAKQ